jgi:hypothetical protein
MHCDISKEINEILEEKKIVLLVSESFSRFSGAREEGPTTCTK